MCEAGGLINPVVCVCCCHRVFRIIDDDGSRSLDMSEFKKGLKDYGLSVSDAVSACHVELSGDETELSACTPLLPHRMPRPCSSSLTQMAVGAFRLMSS